VNIREVGKWKKKIRSMYEKSMISEKKINKINIDGNYGEGNKDWYKYDVEVLVGGGIGVNKFD
jgi:predicted ferric reductase